VGRLGGHLNRKSDGLPGWQTLWHGMTKLGLLGVRPVEYIFKAGHQCEIMFGALS
jgi:hypothetical protein